MKWTLVFLFNLFGYGLEAQAVKPKVEPVKVHLSETNRLPQAYALAENHYSLAAYFPVVGLKVVSDTSLWEVKIGMDDSFVLKCRKYGRIELVELDSIIRLRAKLINGDTIDLVAPIQVYADVNVTPNVTPITMDDIPVLSCQEPISFYAQWDYPAYAKRIFRVNVVFEIELLSMDQRIDGVTGWYDSGDRTRFRDYSMHCGKPDLVFRVKNIKTIQRYKQNGSWVTLHLSKDFPSVWRLQ